MNIADIDFGNGVNEPTTGGSPTPKETPEPLPNNGEEKANLEHNGEKNDINNLDLGNQNTPPVEKNDNSETNKPAKQASTESNNETTLEVGTEFEFDGQHYKVAENGDIVDDKGTVFKAAAQVKDWLATVQTEEEKEEKSDEFDIKKLQDEIGVEITDDKGNPVEFENSITGVKSYVDSVMEIKSKEIADATLNRFMEDNPIIPQFIDYCQLNGSPIGFGQIPDRSNIQLNKDNEQQLEAVIRMAANEFGNASLNDNYIKYLKDSGGLFDEAQNQLNALIKKDKAYMEDMQKQAAAQREAEEKTVEEYWTKINSIIESRNIAGFKIPESFTKEENGKKMIYTTNDFFDYLTRANVDTKDGRKITAYDRDLNNMSEDDLLQRDLIAAWLMFTGGSYKDLAAMQINENKVKELRLKSKEQRATKPLKFVSKKQGKVNISDLLLS